MYWKTIAIMTPAVAATLLLSACASTGGPEFGDSVRHMTEKQIHNLDAAHNPDPAPVVGGDVYKLDDVLDAHRNNAEDPTEDRGALVTGY
jgi:hypothetical protein